MLLLGGAGPRHAAHQFRRIVEEAARLGLGVWLTDRAENLERHPELVALAERTSVLDFGDPERCAEWALGQRDRRAIACVFGYREYAVEAVAAVARALSLPGSPPEAVAVVRSKPRCRARLAELGFAQPRFWVCSSADEGRERWAAIGGPCVVKPPASMGSEGVSLVRAAGDWPAAMARLDGRTPFLVEAFQAGRELSVEGVFLGGEPRVLALTDKTTTGPPHFIELGHATPAAVPAPVRSTVARTVAAALSGLGLRCGAFHVELWQDGDEVVLGEVHVRPGGDYIHLLVEHTLDVDLFGLVFGDAIGRPAPARAAPEPRRGAAVRFLTARPGRLTAVRGWNAVTSDPSCVLAELVVRTGDEIAPLRSSADRPGVVVAGARTAAEAAERAERMASLVSLCTVPPEASA